MIATNKWIENFYNLNVSTATYTMTRYKPNNSTALLWTLVSRFYSSDQTEKFLPGKTSEEMVQILAKHCFKTNLINSRSFQCIKLLCRAKCLWYMQLGQLLFPVFDPFSSLLEALGSCFVGECHSSESAEDCRMLRCRSVHIWCRVEHFKPAMHKEGDSDAY